MIVDINRTYVSLSDGRSFRRVRFVYSNGRAAVWEEDRRLRKATRVLYATGVEFIKGPTARTPNKVIEQDGTVWEVNQVGGGCACGSRLKSMSIDELLSEDLVSAE